MKKFFSVQSWQRGPLDYSTEPLLDPGRDSGSLASHCGRKLKDKTATESAAQPWATLEPTYCPPLIARGAATPQPDLPVSQPSRHPDDTPRAVASPKGHRSAAAQAAPYHPIGNQQLLEPLLVAHSDAEHLQPSSPKHGWHENEEIMNITASHVGDGACFRRTVSINQKQTPDRSPKRSRSDLGSNTSLAGMARAAELALKPAAQEQHSPRSPFHKQPSTTSTGASSLSKPPSLLGLHNSAFLSMMQAQHQAAEQEQQQQQDGSPSSSFASNLHALSTGYYGPPHSPLAQGMHPDLLRSHGMHPYTGHPMYLPLHASSKVPFHHLNGGFGQTGVDRAHDAVNIWRSALKWVVLWLTLSVLTILNSIALVIVLQNDVFALICAVMFCWSGVLGLVGAIRTLLGHCLAREHDLDGALEGYHLKMVEILGFTTCALSALASGAHFVSEQIVTRDMHLPACDKGDTHCMEFYNMIIIMMVATTVLYGFHSVVGAVVTFKAHSTRHMATARGHQLPL